jgi:hypothetical protein
MRLQLLTILASAALAGPLAVAALASAGPRDFGPHTKAELATLCRQHQGTLASSPSKWSCDTARWLVACIDNGKTCTISYYTLLPDGSHVASSTTQSPPTGGGLSGGYGSAGAGGHIGGLPHS